MKETTCNYQNKSTFNTSEISTVMDNTDEIKHFLKDEFLMKQCQDATKTMIEAGMKIDEVSKVIKDYQQKYICINSTEEGRALPCFTFEMWHKCQPWYNPNP